MGDCPRSCATRTAARLRNIITLVNFDDTQERREQISDLIRSRLAICLSFAQPLESGIVFQSKLGISAPSRYLVLESFQTASRMVPVQHLSEDASFAHQAVKAKSQYKSSPAAVQYSPPRIRLCTSTCPGHPPSQTSKLWYSYKPARKQLR